MVVFVSDIHFSQDTADQEQVKEATLLACLRTYEATVGHLVLMGDVFDAYIEYRHLIPKGFVRFQALLAEWTDRGVPITYLVGNHDPWHRDYFARELGVRVVMDPITEPLCGRNVYLAHGDGIHEDEGLYRRLKPWLRHPLAVRLYQSLLPGDSGFRLARWVSAQGDKTLDPGKAVALRQHARRMLAEGAGLAVLGHTHQPELRNWPEGQYLNPGSWRITRTFGLLDEKELKLLHWNGDCALEVETVVLPRPHTA